MCQNKIVKTYFKFDIHLTVKQYCLFQFYKQKIQMSEPTGNLRGLSEKSPLSQQINYIQWGVSRPEQDQQELSRRYSKHLNEINEQIYINDKKLSGQAGEDGRPYHTQYSQVSAIETGFKKLKSNQIQILKELKKQYEVLRNTSLDSRVFLNKKMTSESQSNGEQNSITGSQAQSSFKSKTIRSSQKKYDGRQLKLLSLQKKQLEVMLNNSMKKIEQLLHSQIELKKTIMQLKSKLQSTKSSQNQFEFIIKRYKDNEDSLNRTIDQLKRQIQSNKIKIKEITLSSGNLSGTVNIKDVQIRKKDDKIKALEEQIMHQKNKYLSLELDLKKIKMEYELLERTKNEEISILNKNKNHNEEYDGKLKIKKIRELQEELKVKQERYRLLFNNSKKEQLEDQKTLQKLINTLREEKSQQGNEAITLIMDKLNQIHSKADTHLIGELQNVKNELQQLKSSTYANRDSSGVDLQRKVKDLQKIIDEQNIQKMYFIEDLKKLTKDYSDVKKERDDLQKQVKDLKYILDRLEDQNKRYRLDIDKIKTINIDLTESQHQNKNLLGKLQHFNLKQIEVNNMKEQIHRQTESIKNKEQAYEQEIRLLKRQLNQQEFKVYKANEENQLRGNLLKIEHQSEITRLQDQLQRVKKSYALEKSQLLNSKIQLQAKLLDKNRQLDINVTKIGNNSKQREMAIEQIRADYEARTKDQHERHIAQINGLISKIQSLTQSNERYILQGQKYAQIELQILQLKKLMRTNRQITNNVDHLWQIKQAEYSNVNQILKQLKIS